MKNLKPVLMGLALFIPSFIVGEFQEAKAQAFQQWVARYNGPGNDEDAASSLAVDEYGNVYVTGASEGNGSYFDYATMKYDSTGLLQWIARYDGPGNSADFAYGLVLDVDGNVYVTGSSTGDGTDDDYATIKYNSDGIEQWVARYNGPENDDDDAFRIAIDDDGYIYVTGQSDGIGTGQDYATIKYSPDGVEQWVARYNGPGNYIDQARSLAVDADGNVFITGYSLGYGTYGDCATIKYNSEGVELWIVRHDGPASSGDAGNALVLDDEGNVYVTGYSSGIGTSHDYYTIKYSPDGIEQWSARYFNQGNQYDEAEDITLDENGNVIITGRSHGAPSVYTDYATVMYDVNGTEQWVARYDGPANGTEHGYSVVADIDGNVYVAGYSDGIPGGVTNFDYAIVKYNPDGAEQWVARYDGTGSSYYGSGFSLIVDADYNVYGAGLIAGIGIEYDYGTVKYSQMSQAYAAVILTPLTYPVQIPASGGSFDFYAFISNNLGNPITLDIWLSVTLPNDLMISPLCDPVNTALNPGTVGWYRSQSVPGRAPFGVYTYTCYAGIFPYLVWGSDNFEFEKLETGGGPWVDSWANEGQEFNLISNEISSAIPEEFAVNDAYPNPFNPTTHITFVLPEAAKVNLSIYDVSGRLVTELVDGWRNAGTHQVTFDGSHLASGIYIYNLTAGDYTASGKMVLMK